MISFRTRLFVTAGLIVTAVIATVMFIGWSRVLAFEAERLEQRLCMEARRIATEPTHGEDVSHLANDVIAKLHLASHDQLILRFEARTKGESFQSVNGHTETAFDTAQWRAEKNTVAPNASVNPKQLPPIRPDEDVQPPIGGTPSPRGEGAPRGDRPPLQERLPARDRLNASDACEFASFEAQSKTWRAVRFNVPAGRSVLAVDLVATQADVQSALKQALEMVIPLAIVLTALGAWLLSALTMRPVNRLSDAMKQVTPNALDRRLSSDGEDREFKVLIDAYNTMLSRLEASFQQASRFSADAAHELKTPLTILQGRIEQALTKADHPAMQSELIELLDEVGRLSTITRKLLLLSQADAGWLALYRVPIDLSSMLDEIAADAQMLLTDQTLDCKVERPMTVLGDAVLLRQLFNNLISNAVRYCRPGGSIELRACMQPAGVEVAFLNASNTISNEHRARFFDRFYRGDAAHNRSVDGYGLGLSLSREIARAHGGDLVLMATEPDWVELRLTLPAAG
jgi:two-component system, OmpR family, heavy metal sensor histidine kinase CusS